jgi:hypothetical protein
MITVKTETSTNFAIPVVTVNDNFDVVIAIGETTITLPARTAETTGCALMAAYHQAVAAYEASKGSE